MTLNNLIDRAGDWNPQLFRELKERLKLKNIGLITVASVLIQGFVCFYFNSQIPVAIADTNKDGASLMSIVPNHSQYCLNDVPKPANLIRYYDSVYPCTLDPLGQVNIDWQHWWLNLFICLSWILPLGLILGSVYLLVADLVQEEKRGTLNFIRLSPQSTKTIFIGKILGVPSIVYLAVAVMLPFHLFAGITAGGTIPLIAAWYLTIGSIWFLLSSAAVLFVLLGGTQAILTVCAVAYPVGIPILVINFYLSGAINRNGWFMDNAIINNVKSWFWLPVSGSALGLYTFGIGSCIVATYWVWQALERRYLNPTATVLSKFQSYQINLLLGIWFAGFAIPIVLRGEMSMSDRAGMTISMAIVHFLSVFVLIPLLLPSKQALQDWSRYRRERVTHQPRSFWQRDLVQDLIRNDKSPALLTLAINIGMAIALWLPVGLIALPRETHGVRYVAGLCLGASLIMIYATIAHWVLFLNLKKRNIWLVAIVGGMMILPIGFAIVLSHNSQPMGLAAILLLFSPLAPVGILGLSGWSILATFGAQLALLAGLTHQFQRKLQVSGESQTKRALLIQ
jgi:hypothetical protein